MLLENYPVTCLCGLYPLICTLLRSKTQLVQHCIHIKITTLPDLKKQILKGDYFIFAEQYTGGKWPCFTLNKSHVWPGRHLDPTWFNSPSVTTCCWLTYTQKTTQPWTHHWILRSWKSPENVSAPQGFCSIASKFTEAPSFVTAAAMVPSILTEHWPKPCQRCYEVSKILEAIPISKNSDSLRVMHWISFNISIMFLIDNWRSIRECQTLYWYKHAHTAQLENGRRLGIMNTTGLRV